jgi:hypothetical protein
MPSRVRSVLAGRGFMLLPAAAFGVHQLRYELGYGSRSGAALAAQGHGYQNSLAPWVVVLIAVAVGTFLARVARAATGRAETRRRSFAALFGFAWALLFVVYCVQEWLEGMFAVGHPAGAAGIVGHGGWWAVPLSAVAAAVVALLLLIGAAVVEVVARVASPALARVELLLHRPLPVVSVRRSPLAGRMAGRAPPAV